MKPELVCSRASPSNKDFLTRAVNPVLVTLVEIPFACHCLAHSTGSCFVCVSSLNIRLLLCIELPLIKWNANGCIYRVSSLKPWSRGDKLRWSDWSVHQVNLVECVVAGQPCALHTWWSRSRQRKTELVHCHGQLPHNCHLLRSPQMTSQTVNRKLPPLTHAKLQETHIMLQLWIVIIGFSANPFTGSNHLNTALAQNHGMKDSKLRTTLLNQS